jgi:lipid-binding SYLF domain-containing protein
LALITLGCAGLVFAAAPAAADSGDAPGAARIAESIRVLGELVDIPEEGLPAALLDKCQGLAIIPGVVKAAYGFGGQYGRGLIVVKNEAGEWSNPVFVSLIGGSIGWQIGVQKSDVILVFKTRRGIDNVVDGDLTLGADIGVAAGPVGRSAEASTDLELKAEIYSYSKSKGLFAGVSIKGATLQTDDDANQAFYGRGLDPHDIFFDRSLDGAASVADLKKALDRYTPKRF